MELYLVRHAEAAAGTPDHSRPLTPAGREQARSLGARLRESGVSPDAIVTSPLVRARETGSLLAAALGTEATADERLAPGASATDVTEVVRGLGETVIAIGHQPDCSRIAAALTGGPEPSFPPAGSLAIQLDS
jgi:phosphohistidine phosphatase SixA